MRLNEPESPVLVIEIQMLIVKCHEYVIVLESTPLHITSFLNLCSTFIKFVCLKLTFLVQNMK